MVEDDESSRISGKYALDEWYDIITTETAAKALTLLEKERFDLVLLDIIIRNEGEESGINALKIINEKYPQLPVVMVSGSLTWVKQWEKLKQLGANGYLVKPYDRHKAKAIIELCLKGERLDTPW